MDNFRFDMICEGDSMLEEALKLVWKATGNEGEGLGTRRRGATHYAVREPVKAVKDPSKPHLDNSGKPRRIVFFSYASSSLSDDLVRLPFHLDAKGAADFARRWLAEADYGKEPDHDGSNKRGWRVYNEACGQVDDNHGAIIAVAPVWATYGK